MNPHDHVILHDIDIETLKHGLAEGSIVLVDVREVNEYEAGHIAGALLNPLSRFDPLQLPPPSKDKTIVLHCRSGRRSIDGLALAQKAGRSDIQTHYSGGMLNWLAHGEPVER